MKGVLRLAALAALASGLVLAGAAEGAAAAAFKRGATIVEFFSFPATVGEGAAKTYAQAPFPHLQSALARMNFDDLRQVGFDHMRIPIDLGPMMGGSERQRGEIVDALMMVIATLHRHGLGALVTLIPPSLQHELPETYLDGLDGPRFRLYFAMVERIADALKSVHSGPLAFEPMNEPQSTCRVRFGLDWTAYQQFMVERIRRIAADLSILLTGGCWSNIEGIVLLDSDLLRDPRNLVSVHFYYPFLFTHQSATWTMSYLAGTIGVPYPASAGSLEETLSLTRERFQNLQASNGIDRQGARQKAEAEIRRHFREAQGPSQVEDWMNQVADWQKRQRVDSDRIVFTEFGAMKQTIDAVEIDRASRARWLRDASSAIESRGFGWTVYVLLDDPFGLYLRPTDRYPDPQLLRALRLNVPDDDHRAGRP
ncbi:MAG TPA: cellulase family glycosylhydrolase [Xanthobacteraceae bacterium]